MPAETLHLCYRRDYRPNRRRPKHPILQAIVRLALLIVALGVVIGILIRMGYIQEPEREIYVAAHMKRAILSADRTKSDSLLVSCRANSIRLSDSFTDEC